MKRHFCALLVVACGMGAGFTVPADAQDSAAGVEAVAAGGSSVSDAEARRAYDAARKSFEVMAAGTDSPTLLPGDHEYEVSVFSDPDRQTHDLKGLPANVSLEDVKVVIDVENVTLQAVINRVVEQAAAYTGPWTVKWRLRPENSALLSERVNLTAEAKFGGFMDVLTERIRNMNGTQLYVTVFPAARVLMVSDTYY